jgi:hypothetical protein
MGLLGDILPKVTEEVSSGITSVEQSVSSFLKGGTSDFSLSNIETKLSEGASKLFNSFGSKTTSTFTDLASGIPTSGISNIFSVGNGQTLNDNTSTAAPRSNNLGVIVSLKSAVTGETVLFRASPRVGESDSAQYSEVNIVQHPGAILKYEKTSARQWSVSAKLISRTQQEASENQKYLNLLRGWVKPFYGAGTEKNAPSKLGAPPEVLIFSGYGEKNIPKVPVVLESRSWDWPNDCDYIPTLTGDPFPVIIDVSLSLKESYSPAEYSNFNLYAYKAGVISKAFSGGRFAAGKSSTANAKIDTSTPPILGGKNGFEALGGGTNIGTLPGAPNLDINFPGLPSITSTPTLSEVASSGDAGSMINSLASSTPTIDV